MGFPLLGVWNKFIKVTNLLLNRKRAFYLSLSMSSWKWRSYLSALVWHMLRLVCHDPSGVNESILICSVWILLVLNISRVSDKLLRPECLLGNQNQDLYIQYMYCTSSNLSWWGENSHRKLHVVQFFSKQVIYKIKYMDTF